MNKFLKQLAIESDQQIEEIRLGFFRPVQLIDGKLVRGDLVEAAILRYVKDD